MKFKDLIELLKNTYVDFKVYDNYDRYDHYVYVNHGQLTFYIDNDEISMSYCNCERKDTSLLIDTLKTLQKRTRHIKTFWDEDSPYITMDKPIPKSYDYKNTVKHHLLEYYFYSKQLQEADLYLNVPESHLLEIDKMFHSRNPTRDFLHSHILSKDFSKLKEKLKNEDYVNELLSKIPEEIYTLRTKREMI